MKIILLGGSGFVGSRLSADLISQSHNVIIADIAKSEAYPTLWKHCDVRNKQQLRECCDGADLIINLAAEHRDDVNVEGAKILCEVASELGIKRIIFTSSVAIYGFPETPLDESGKANYFNDYGRTKWLAEAEYRKWKDADITNRLTIIRPTVIFGEGNRGNVYNLIRQISSGKFLMIGRGQNEKSMAYVGNICAFIEYALIQDYQDETFNYVDKPDFNMKELVARVTDILGRKLLLPFSVPAWIVYTVAAFFDLLAKVSGRKFPISVIRVKKFESQTIFDATKMLQSGFVPPYSMSDALERTIRHEFID